MTKPWGRQGSLACHQLQQDLCFLLRVLGHPAQATAPTNPPLWPGVESSPVCTTSMLLPIMYLFLNVNKQAAASD